MFGGYPEKQRNAELNSLNSQYKNSTIMEAAYKASQVGTAATATASAYGYQMPANPATYSSVNSGSINNSAAVSTGYVSSNQIYQNQTMSNNAGQTGLYNSGQYQFSGSYLSNPAGQQANSMSAYQKNLMSSQRSSIGYQGNSMGYQANPAGYQTNLVGYQGSYNHPAAVAGQLAYQYNNANYYHNTAIQGYQTQQSTGGFRNQSNWQKRESKNNAMNKKAPPKAFQVHYCEVCKISCTGSNTYNEHLEGQKHKKKEILSKTEVSENSTNLSTSLIQCKLCNVSCSGKDAYDSHIRGSKHQKVILLHTKLGKEIPTEEPVLGNVTECSNGKDESETDVQPVGEDYVEEIKNEAGAVVNFKCKLCDCQFSDKNAKNIHMKGRRHRLQYKKKVDSSLLVDFKPTSYRKKIQEKKLNQSSRTLNPQRQNFGNQEIPIYRHYKSRDDRYVMTKYFEIHPKKEEIQSMLRVVHDTEKALKIVSDELFEKKPKDDNNESVPDQNDKVQNSDSVIQGVWRVNHLAKSLLLHKETTAELVVICSERPTFTLLRKIVELLPEAFKKVTTEHAYSVIINTTEAGLIVSENGITVLIQLTNETLQAECNNVESNQDNLASEKCSHALKSFKQTKWFYDTVTYLPYCSEVILVLRDLCQNVPTLMPLNCWILELLVEKVVVSSLLNKIEYSSGDVFRRVMESIASGILLNGGPGLIDPCEEEDAPNGIEFLTAQQREDITAFAQNALRLIAFQKIHEVLKMDAFHKKNYSYSKGISQKRLSSEEAENCNEKKIKLTSENVSNTLENFAQN